MLVRLRKMWIFHNFLFVVLKYSRCSLVVLCALCITIIGYSLLLVTEKRQFNTNHILAYDVTCDIHSPVVTLFGIKENDRTLSVVENVFLNLGYRVQFNVSKEWDILWSYTYPFHTLSMEMSSLKQQQKINHFPGSGFITQKSNLAALPLKNIPKSFLMPGDKELFMQYAQNNMNKSWIMKSSSHRDMKVIDKNSSFDVHGVFVQEFIQYPLLISGKKFDIGVYVMLTSIDPLRVYMYSEDILLRFCTKDYYPFNLASPESYIVGDDYLPVWDVPDLQFYFSELNYTAKESLNAYLQHQGKNVKKFWHQIHETIQNVYIHTEENLKQSSLMFDYRRRFFELVRFDFIADEDLNIFLLEVNMSPNLSPAHFPQNNLLYKQIVFNSLSLIGLIRKFPYSFGHREEIDVSQKDIQVFPELCTSKACQSSCEIVECYACNQCMNSELMEIAKAAYLEFVDRGKYRRLVPLPQVEDMEKKQLKNLSFMNAFMNTWFNGKCLQDISWCF